MVSTNVGFGTAALGTSLRFISWNIKVMGHPVKRSKVFTHLKQLKSSIVFLQETHLRNKNHHRLHCSWVGQVFHSEFNSKSRGVVILISKKVQFSATNIIADKNGRYVIVAGILMQKKVLLMYMPQILMMLNLLISY